MNANLPVRWLTDPIMLSLSDAATATYHRSLMFGVHHENDGAIDRKALRLLVSPDADPHEVTAELVEAGLWTVTDTGYQVERWDESQTTSVEAEKQRAGWRKRKNDQRKREAEQVVTRDTNVNHVGVTQPPQIRSDQTSSDQAMTTEKESEALRVLDWEVVQPPVGESEPEFVLSDADRAAAF